MRASERTDDAVSSLVLASQQTAALSSSISFRRSMSPVAATAAKASKVLAAGSPWKVDILATRARGLPQHREERVTAQSWRTRRDEGKNFSICKPRTSDQNLCKAII